METALISPFLLMRQAWALALARSNLASFFILGALPQALSIAFSALITFTTGSQTALTDLIASSSGWAIGGIIIAGLLVVLLVSLLSAWYTAILYSVYAATSQGKLPSLMSFVSPARQRTVPLLVTYITVGLVTLGGFILLIIPGIIFAVRYMFAPLIAVVEERTVKPLAESKRLAQGRFWKLVGRGLLMVIAYNVPLTILQSVHPYLGSVWAITSPVFGLYFYLVYADCKRATPAAA